MIINLIIIGLVYVLLSCIFHELAHFFIARLVNCHINAISIGFGKPLLKFYHKGIVWSIRPWLIGGCCKLLGELEYYPANNAFCNLTYTKKALITLAGVIANTIIGLLGVLYFQTNVLIYWFGWCNLLLAATNIIPFPPLDGSYLFMVFLEKRVGKIKCYTIMKRLCSLGFRILIWANIACIPYVFHLIKHYSK